MRILVLAFLCLLSGMAVAQVDTLNTPEDVRLVSEQIVKHFVAEEFSEGMDLVKKNWIFTGTNLDDTQSTIESQWVTISQQFGAPLGYELIYENMLGTSLVRLVYLHKFEKHFIYWSFTFYKPDDVWVMDAFNFKDDVDKLFTLVK